MTSRKIENVHLELLEKLFADSGLECIRSPVLSSESSSSLGASEEHGEEEEEEEAAIETVAEEEEKSPVVEEELEELPEIFPSPSLRHLLSDKVRHIQKQNRIHVLPEEFKKRINPQNIPKIAVTPQQKYIEMLGDLVGCKRYRSSLAEFWFLDTLANLLWRAQDDELDRPTQAILILWFCEWMKEMQHFDAASRPRMMKRFKDNMLAAAKILATEDRLPAPSEAGVYYKAVDEPDDPEHTKSSTHTIKHLVNFEGAVYECCLRDLIKIIHYIFDLFSSDYQYNLVRSVFTFTPEYALIDAPYQIQNPKRMYAALKVKPKKEAKSPKKEIKPVKGKRKEDTSEYLALLDLKAKEDKLLEEQEERDREEWNRRSHILPLNFAAGDEFFNKYWPPPTPAPEPEVVLDLKTKAKPKGKK
ncbi:uncharacterized protein LOC113494811 isoform X2 [Trichoplusia ni]|uniref:Uncharacterized protein LOC113494811 isoform X2 n=1 Tax=Trichoplusia ni TaxID=7111 RepID=A0A7E5VLM3_TRINI|nr:uncharacterized protein LOC113494811 isoform X2 [Trichoplusia ni]